MALPGSRACTWTLLLCLNWIFLDGAAAKPHFMVAIPAVIEAGSENKLCASLLQPNETLAMTATLVFNNKKTVIFEKSSDTEFHHCANFQAPEVQISEVHTLTVSVRGEQFNSVDSRKVMFRSYKPNTFIQTDKPIYLPGQTVHFRVVTLDAKFRPANELYQVIELRDPHQNRIGQWLNATSNGKILQLSYSLNSEAREGHYQIVVWINENPVIQSFKVEKYVLPKFEVTFKTSDKVSVGEEELEVDVCVKYTYGPPVPATVNIEMCRRIRDFYHDQVQVPCFKQEKETDKNGCAKFLPKMLVFTKIDAKVLQNSVSITAKAQEEGTGIVLSNQKVVELSYIIGKLSFVDTPKLYKEGSMLEGKIKVVHYNDTPVPYKLIQLMNDKDWKPQNLTTDAEGIATFSLNTTQFNQENIRLRAVVAGEQHYFQQPHFESAQHIATLFQPPSPHSPSVSSLTVKNKDNPLPCDGEETISIQYNFVGEATGAVDLMYLIVSRGKIVNHGVQKVEILNDPVTTGSTSFTVKMSPELSPVLQVVAYVILPSEHVIAHTADLNVNKCFSNKVSVEFSSTSPVPGEDATLKLKALPDSLCGVSAVDQSVLIKEPGNTLTTDRIFDILPVKKVSSIPYEVEDIAPCIRVRQKRYIMPSLPDHSNDAYSVFESVGLKVATNLLIRMPSCVKFKGLEFHRGLMLYSEPRIMAMRTYSMAELAPQGAAGGRGGGVIETIRAFFPETWVWKLVEVGKSGQTDVPLTVPDTITTWETEAFCLSPQGFGLAPRTHITAYQPFFLELSLPYSIVRGEQFELKATVFNYQFSCLMVSVKAAPSEEYTLTPLSGNEYTSCLCGNERKTLSWTMLPSVLGVVNVTVAAEAMASHASCDNEIVDVPERGRIDRVTRSLIVKAEGMEMAKTHNWLLCPKEESLKEQVELELPENVIDGSARASVSVLGDILGRALKNLDGLLKMPYGCGEQNMALLAPNIYILQYLKSTGQLTDAILKKATHFLTSGYQRQLNYKHSDGPFSTFGTGDGNTWLTAFVLRSFAKAKSFIYIGSMEESKGWLLRRQKENGCFEQSGKLFNNRMKGGVSDEVTLSAYVTAAFLEMNMTVADSSVNRSLACLKGATSNLNNTYTTALMAYVFAMAGDIKTRDFLLQHLDSVASQQGGLLHWSQSTKEGSSSLSVEIGSYVLLAKLSGSPTAEDLGYASRIVRWLTGKQNYYGGFSSTQDTVVALQALALYSTLVFSPKGSSTVTVQAPSGQLVFDVNQNNKLLYQEELLRDLKGTISLEAKGSMCASIQISLHYNIPTPANTNIFSVEVKPECQTQKNKVTLKLASLYKGQDSPTNMVILDIAMLSGFVPDPNSVNMLQKALLVDRVEEKEGRVLVYITELLKDLPIYHSLDLIQEVKVQNLKPALVKIYDYYQPSDQAETEYVFTCNAD